MHERIIIDYQPIWSFVQKLKTMFFACFIVQKPTKAVLVAYILFEHTMYRKITFISLWEREFSDRKWRLGKFWTESFWDREVAVEFANTSESVWCAHHSQVAHSMYCDVELLANFPIDRHFRRVIFSSAEQKNKQKTHQVRLFISFCMETRINPASFGEQDGKEWLFWVCMWRGRKRNHSEQTISQRVEE